MEIMKEIENHRIRVAAERRNETQEKLLLSGLILGSKKPVKEISIEEIYTHAQTSRGTFYKYFTGTTGLFKALGLNVANQIVELLAPLKAPFTDPAITIASMTRIGIRLAVSIPMLGRLLLQAEWPNADKNTGILRDIEKDIKAGIKQGRFSDIPTDIGLGIVVGTTKAAIHSMLQNPPSKGYEDIVACQILIGLGVDEKSAKEISKLPLPTLPALPTTGIIGKVLLMTNSKRKS
jgi:TetR/AcrR family transcriptional regulator, ethionamide resistance regulator